MGMGRFGLCIDLQTACDRLCIIALSLGSYHTLLVHSSTFTLQPTLMVSKASICVLASH